MNYRLIADTDYTTIIDADLVSFIEYHIHIEGSLNNSSSLLIIFGKKENAAVMLETRHFWGKKMMHFGQKNAAVSGQNGYSQSCIKTALQIAQDL